MPENFVPPHFSAQSYATDRLPVRIYNQIQWKVQGLVCSVPSWRTWKIIVEKKSGHPAPSAPERNNAKLGQI